jgi:hypothetical protein
MPRLIRTPEEVLRKTRRNLYFLEFNKVNPFRFSDDIEKIPGRREIFAWFARECPDVELEDLAPREASGFICGGFGILVRVAFDKKSLAKYCAAWENADESPKDPRWTCYIYPYRQYLKEAVEIREIRKREMADL